MKKSILLLSLVLTTPLHATKNITESLPSEAYNALAKVFPMEQLTEQDEIRLEQVIPMNSKLYMVSLNDSVLAISEDGKHVISGDIVNLEKMVNYTDVAKNGSIKRSMSSLTQESYIRYPSSLPETKRVIYIFSDLTCGYCKLMHEEYSAINDAGIEIRVVPFLRNIGMDGVENTDNYKNTVGMMSILDEVARREMHDNLFAETSTKPLIANKKGIDAISTGIDSGVKAGLRGTPHIVLDDGRTLAGYIKADSILKELLN